MAVTGNNPTNQTNQDDNQNLDNLVIINGINGATGEYLNEPISLAEAAKLMREFQPTAEEAARDLAVKRRQAKSSQEVLGLPQGVDPLEFGETGWAIVFHKDEDPAVKKAMRPLFERRLRMIRDEFETDDADKIVKWIENYNGESARDWLIQNKADFATVNPTCMPYYILLVGSPEKIPFKFGHLLAAGYAVGRLYFDKVEEYSTYVNSVIEYEEKAKKAPTNKDIVYFGPRQKNDGATKLSSELLVKPLADDQQTRIYKRLKTNESIIYNRRYLTPEESKKQALLDVFKRGKNKPAPSLLFTASHGLAWPNGDDRQAPAQGALLCQDYFGITAGALKPEHYFAGADLSADANVFGMICFFFACYGGGTPNVNRFKLQKNEQPVVPDKPFFSRLPQALLSHPKGGALGIFGHVERAWQTSIVTAGAGKQLQPFEDAFYTILSGRPLGHALVGFSNRANELSRQMTGMIEDGKASDADLAGLWLARNDAETFILFGDPAVRLRKGDLQ